MLAGSSPSSPVNSGSSLFPTALNGAALKDRRSLLPPQTAADRRRQADILEGITLFQRWLQHRGHVSYDPYDVWGTRYGLYARRVFYANRILGAPLVAPLVLLELLLPQGRKLLVRKTRHPIAEAHLILGYANIFALTQDPTDLDVAVTLSRNLLAMSIPGYSGHCWGYPFDWQSNRGLWKRGTPFITVTPYGFEAFLALHDLVGDRNYLDIAYSATQFALRDLQETVIDGRMSACSYSPVDQSLIVNASAYRAMMLLTAFERFGEERLRSAGLKNLEFVLNHQRLDGSWLYAVGNPQDGFIDHFHTCMVLKNLSKANRIVKDPRIEESIRKGYAYYRTALFDDRDEPIPFASGHRLQLVERELYDYAESISLGALLADEIPGALDLSKRLTQRVLQQYQLPDGHFVTRVHRGGWRHTMPYLRWPQAQLFHALTALLRRVARAKQETPVLADGS